MSASKNDPTLLIIEFKTIDINLLQYRCWKITSVVNILPLRNISFYASKICPIHCFRWVWFYYLMKRHYFLFLLFCEFNPYLWCPMDDFIPQYPLINLFVDKLIKRSIFERIFITIGNSTQEKDKSFE